jgi:asparagine synthase (glutamine-hydrolysing)
MQYLAFGYIPDPCSIFEGVRKLPPGHTLTWTKAAGAVVEQYWTPPTVGSVRLDEAEIVETLRGLLDHAVASHLESEVPLGAFLSGGLDSSTVVALMCRHARGRVRTFSIGFGEEEFDESASARSVAAYFGTDHSAFTVRPDIESMFDGIVDMFDEPFADSSAIPTFLVAQLARQYVTVVLSGDGGDELFGGYTRYGKTLERTAMPSALDRYLAAVGLMLPHVFPGKNHLMNRGRTPWGRYAATVVQPVRLAEGGVASASLAGGRVSVQEQLRDYVAREVGDDFAASMMRIDMQTYLPGDILTKVDRTSMAVSLEARVPLLDAQLVDFAMSLPGDMRVTPEQSKRMFRKAIAGIVPDDVLRRPKKGFEIPLGRWFRGPLRHRVEALRHPSPELALFVDEHSVQRLVSEHVFGRRDHSGVLWRLIVLDRWLHSMSQGKLALPPSLPAMPT